MVILTFVHGYESKYYSGPLRPFINWAEKIIEMYPRKIDLSLILFKSNPEIINNFNPKLRKKLILVNNDSKFSRVIKDLNPDIIMTDDYFPRLKLLEKIRGNRSGTKTVIYVQFLYGIHSISNCFHYNQISPKEKFIYKVSSLIPYKLLSLKYTKVLKKNSAFIPNSKITKNLIFWLYKIHAEDVIYPPVNTDIFKPHDNVADKNSDTILIYLGSSGGDVDLNFLCKIVEMIIKRNFKVCLFGNEAIGKAIRELFKGKVEYYENLSDIELAKLYSKSLITICPQTWELFGYVAVESMACGAPVLAFDYFGHSETIIDRKTGLLASTYDDFAQKLKLILNKSIKFNRKTVRKHVIENFSAKRSTEKLVSYILSLDSQGIRE